LLDDLASPPGQGQHATSYSYDYYRETTTDSMVGKREKPERPKYAGRQYNQDAKLVERVPPDLAKRQMQKPIAKLRKGRRCTF
jgi:hypothetical protein